MSFLERFRRRDHVSNTAAAVAVAASVERQSPKTPEEYYQAVEERRMQLIDGHNAFLENSYREGLRDQALADTAAIAINEQQLPSMIRGMTFRGSGFSLVFLSGQIEPGMLKTRIQDAGSERSSFRATLDLNPDYFIGRTIDPATFTYESSPLLPQHSSSRFPYDQAVLDTIDRHMSGLVAVGSDPVFEQ